MATWYAGFGKLNTNLTQQLYEYSTSAEMWYEALAFERDCSHFLARVHGNPLLDTCDLGRQPSPSRMRDQVQVYENAFVSADEALKGYEDFFTRMAKAWDKGEGLHIIDADDPMLVNRGEAYVHQQFTDYLAEPMLEPAEQQAPWVGIIRSYLNTQFVTQLANGNIPAPVILEPVRQQLGLAYEWQGAPVED